MVSGLLRARHLIDDATLFAKWFNQDEQPLNVNYNINLELWKNTEENREKSAQMSPFQITNTLNGIDLFGHGLNCKLKVKDHALSFHASNYWWEKEEKQKKNVKEAINSIIICWIEVRRAFMVKI